MASKVVVIGDVNGQFKAVFQKLATLHAKSPFTFAIIAGNLFADPSSATEENDADVQELINGKIPVAFTTYFALGSNSFPPKVVEKLESSDDELCEHLFFLGKRTTMKTTDGVRLVALGGNLDPNIIVGASKDKYPPYYGETDAKILRGATTADILVTNEWPAGIRTRSKVPFTPEVEPRGQECLADLCAVLQPRYHFSTSGNDFYEREPFFYPAVDGAYPITRFISLASYGNLAKKKWIYAFNLDPTASHPIAVPSGTTLTPLSHPDNKKRPAPPRESGLIYEDSHRGGRRQNKRRKGPLSASQCFFCLSNDEIAKHLITSIGDNAYMTTAKGPLPTPQIFPKLGFPGHMLIIPMQHEPTLAAIAQEEREATYTEMQKYRSAMNSMLKSVAGEEYGSVTWEVSKSSLPHTHWQYLPVPADLIHKGLVKAAFEALAENFHWPKFTAEDVGDGSKENSDFFRIEIWDPKDPADQKTSMVMRFDEGIKFHNQFGREVLAKLMKLDRRLDWHDCGQTQQEEEKDVAVFKKAFEKFDFTE